MKAYSVITLIIFAMLVGTPVWADDGIKVIVNGAYLESDTKPVIID